MDPVFLLCHKKLGTGGDPSTETGAHPSKWLSELSEPRSLLKHTLGVTVFPGGLTDGEEGYQCSPAGWRPS